MAMQYVNGGWREPLSQAEPSDAHLMEDDLLDASLYEQLGTLIAGEQGDIYALCCSNSEGSGSSTSKPSISRHRAVEAPGLYNTPQEWGSRCAKRAIAACTVSVFTQAVWYWLGKCDATAGCIVTVRVVMLCV